MTVQHKRCLRVYPIAGLLIASLAVGLTGCGTSVKANAPETQTVIPAVIMAKNPMTVTANQPVTITAPAIADPAANGGVSSLSVVVPQNALGSNQTVGVDVIPLAQGTVALTKAANPTAVVPNPIAEYDFGDITNTQTNVIDVTRPIAFSGSVTTSIGFQQSQSLSTVYSQVMAGTLHLHVYLDQPITATTGTLALTTCYATFTDPQTIVVTGVCSGDLLVTADST